MFAVLLLLFCIIVNVQSNPVASLKKCPSGSNKCVKNAVKEIYAMILNENAEIEAEEMDPMFQKLIEEKFDILKFKMINTTIIGYRTCDIQKASYDREADILQTEFICQKIDIQGLYDLKGRIITVDAEGNGDFRLNCGKYSLNLNLNLETISKNGNNYKNIKSFTFKAEPLEKVEFYLSNLFGGDKQAGDNVLKFLNENWKVVAVAFQDKVFMPNLKKIVKNANKYLKISPV